MNPAKGVWHQATDILGQILDLSYRISVHSPPMKPFIRFAEQADPIYLQGSAFQRSLFWDFDYALQKILLGMAREMATPEQLAALCCAQWALNLQRLQTQRELELQKQIESGGHYQFICTPREEFILRRMKTGARFLYLGCGSGSECLRLASRGLSVTGIDTVPGLVDVANRWAEQLSLPFRAVCMDAMELDLDAESFDGFLVEFYGEQPSLSHALRLQRNLAAVLREGGEGFVVATRKKYSSFWFKMGSLYPQKMTSWLVGQTFLDHRFSSPDGFEEQLRYGLFAIAHTRDSLAAELTRNFKVLDCFYESHDPRYVMAVVSRQGSAEISKSCDDGDIAGAGTVVEAARAEVPCLDTGAMPWKDALQEMAAVCDLLERHEQRVCQFFDGTIPVKEKNPIRAVQTELPRFIELLEGLFVLLALDSNR